MTITPPFTNLHALLAYHIVEGRNWPITLIVGRNWVTAIDAYTYFVNADEPATCEQVEAMLIEANGISELHPSE